MVDFDTHTQKNIWNVRKYLLTTYLIRNYVDFLQINNILIKPQQKLLNKSACGNQEQVGKIERYNPKLMSS